MKIGKASEICQLKTRKQKHQLLIPIPKNNLECNVMKTCVHTKVAEQVEEQMLGVKTFFHGEQKHFVGLGLSGSVPAPNYSFV